MRAAQSGLSGDANAAPIELSPHVGGRPLPQVQLVQAIIFSFLVANVVPNHSLVPADCRYQITSRPEMLANIILFSFPVRSRKVDRALALDVTNHPRHGVIRRYRDQDMHKAGGSPVGNRFRNFFDPFDI